MSDQTPEEAKMTLQLNGREDFEATPENTSLFQFAGQLACYNHVFIQTGEETDEVSMGAYVFNTHPVYHEMVAFMVRHEYPMHLYLREVAECDINAFNNMIAQHASELDNGVPEEWGGGTE